MIDYASLLCEDRYVIFLFHGVIPEESHVIRNYTRKHLPLDDFIVIIDSLSDRGNPVSMDDIVSATSRKASLPKRSFAITFDDGFLNNLTVAAPVLRRFNVPAMFYATTGFIESNTMSWIDEIEYDFEARGSFQIDMLNLRVQCETRSQKIELLDHIRQTIKANRNIDPYAFAHEVRRQIGVQAITPDTYLDQKMNWEQLKELDSDPLFTIGGHSHTHRILSYLNQDELESEVATSIEKLQSHLNRTILHYSYPEGLSHCFSEDVIDRLRRHGIVCSPTAEHGTNAVGDDLFHLKRIFVV